MQRKRRRRKGRRKMGNITGRKRYREGGEEGREA